ncbi:MAG: rhodanese-like domain-containing protein [Phaeodactylibacter sp.]|nr:rhodanese-like domain-containing protein [Phaeodactylibacter sp.]
MRQLTWTEFERWRAEGRNFQLIDVREPEEHGSFNIGGELIPMSGLMRALDRLDSTRPIVVYCKRGIRSQLAIQRWQARLPQAEFYNLVGGIYHLYHA